MFTQHKLVQTQLKSTVLEHVADYTDTQGSVPCMHSIQTGLHTVHG